MEQATKYELVINLKTAKALGITVPPTRPEAVALARRLRRASPKTGQRLSFREISGKLAEADHLNERGQPFNAQSIRAMIEGPQRRQRVKP